MTTSNAIILANPPVTTIQPDTFKLESGRELAALADGEILIRMEYFSNDPAQRGWIQANSDAARAYVKPVRQGDIVRAMGIAVVLDSKSTKWKTGDKVVGMFGWFDVGVVNEAAVTSAAIELPGMPTATLSVLGMVSVTAYQGIFEILKVEKEHVVVISGAAGAVGSLAIQLAKHVIGAKRVIGIAGGPEKCAWVVNHLGADACIDYKAGNLEADLKEALKGDFCDRYFDNVGGDVLNTMFRNVTRHGKIGVCGAISVYNGAKADLSSFTQVISNRIQIEGFIVLDMVPKWAQAVQDLAKWIQEGKIKTDEAEQVVDAQLKDVPEVWQRLFRGENRGKLITKLVE